MSTDGGCTPSPPSAPLINPPGRGWCGYGPGRSATGPGRPLPIGRRVGGLAEPAGRAALPSGGVRPVARLPIAGQAPVRRAAALIVEPREPPAPDEGGELLIPGVVVDHGPSPPPEPENPAGLTLPAGDLRPPLRSVPIRVGAGRVIALLQGASPPR